MTSGSDASDDGGRTYMDSVLRPTGIVIVGFSTKAASLSRIVFEKLVGDRFGGRIFLVGRSAGEFEGHPILPSVESIPHGVDLAILALPADAIRPAVTACIARDVKAGIVFASGFADVGNEGAGEQDRISDLVRDTGMRLIGPNCLGYTNFVNGVSIGFSSNAATERLAEGASGAVAIIAQSGGLAVHLHAALGARGVPVSAWISTGNEVDLGIFDFVRYFVHDSATEVITIYAEALKNPQEVLSLAHEARRIGKPIVLMHSGRGSRAKEAALSHTGSMTGDYAVMRTVLERAGVVVVDTLDELVDVSEILARYPQRSVGDLGVLTFSGAFCGIAHDFCESVGCPVAQLSPETESDLKNHLPDYNKPNNPLDLGTQPIWQPEIVRIGAEALLRDPAVGALAVSIPGGNVRHIAHVQGIAAASKTSVKPVVVAFLGGSAPLPPEVLSVAKENRLILSRSPDRTLRALAKVIERARRGLSAARLSPDIIHRAGSPQKLEGGPQAEWRGKKLLESIGINVPQGGLATTLPEAVAVAAQIGYPVALKAQSAMLTHKTEAGGVVLGIADRQSLETSWDRVHADISRHQPKIVLDGLLVETMSPKGLELMIGARRDPQWGSVLLIGLGGVWVEALGDVRLIAPDLGLEEITTEIGKLRSAALLRGFRNLPALDVSAVAAAVSKLSHLMRSNPWIVEVDVNPLMVHPVGQGATALDALVVADAS